MTRTDEQGEETGRQEVDMMAELEKSSLGVQKNRRSERRQNIHPEASLVQKQPSAIARRFPHLSNDVREARRTRSLTPPPPKRPPLGPGTHVTGAIAEATAQTRPLRALWRLLTGHERLSMSRERLHRRLHHDKWAGWGSLLFSGASRSHAPALSSGRCNMGVEGAVNK